jgi:hypothetical protein
MSTKKKVLIGGALAGGILVSARILRNFSKTRKRTKAEENFLKGFSAEILDYLDFGIPKNQIQEVKKDIAQTIKENPSILEIDIYNTKEGDEVILFV